MEVAWKATLRRKQERRVPSVVDPRLEAVQGPQVANYYVDQDALEGKPIRRIDLLASEDPLGEAVLTTYTLNAVVDVFEEFAIVEDFVVVADEHGAISLEKVREPIKVPKVALSGVFDFHVLRAPRVARCVAGCENPPSDATSKADGHGLHP